MVQRRSDVMLIRALDALIRIEAPVSISELFAELFIDLRDVDCVPDQNASSITWSPTADGNWKVLLGPEGASVTDVPGGLTEMMIELNRRAASSVAADRTVLHAGAFEVGGSAVAVAGVSGAGKSTLVAAAVLQAYGYLADEVCAIDRGEYMVRPYHRPIGLRTGGAEAIGMPVPVRFDDPLPRLYPLPASQIGRLADPAPLRLLALVDRRPGPVELTRLSPAEALVRLTNLGLGSGGWELAMFRRLEDLVRSVHVVTVRYEHAVDAVDALAKAAT